MLKRTLGTTVFVAIAAVVLAGCSTISNLTPPSWKHAAGQSIEVTGHFFSAAGIYPGNDVSVLGMPVGRVISVEPNGAEAIVKFTVDKKWDIPESATAEIVNTSLITTRFIKLSPSYDGGPKLHDGSVIPLERTKSPLEVSKIYDTINNLAKSINAGGGTDPNARSLGDLVNIADNIVVGRGANGEATIDAKELRDAINQLSGVAKLGADNSDELIDIVKKANNLASILVANYPKMQQLSSTFTDISNMLGEQSVGLQESLKSTNDALRNTGTFLTNKVPQAKTAVNNITGLINNLNDYSRELVEGIDLLPLTFQNAGAAYSPEYRAVRIRPLTDKLLFDTDLVGVFCEVVNLQKNGCRTGKLKDFGPDFGIFPMILELAK